MDENPYKSPKTHSSRRPVRWSKAKRWATVAFLALLGSSGIANGVAGFITPLPWSSGGVQSAFYLGMGLLAVYAAYQHARETLRA
jgi:hypothetical protein